MTLTEHLGRTLLRDLVGAKAREEAAKGRAWAPGNEIDTVVLEPYRDVLMKLGLLGRLVRENRFAWCACWVVYVLRQCGVVIPYRVGNLVTSRAQNLLVIAKKYGASKSNTEEPAMGDIALFENDGDPDADHVGIVVGYDPKTDLVETAEGNVRDREQIRKHHRKSLKAYIDLEQFAVELALRENGKP